MATLRLVNTKMELPANCSCSVAKMGSTLAGLMDSFARSISYGLQYGVPLKVYVKGMTSMSFAPAGITDDPDIRTASSLIDYIFRRLALDYLSFDDRLELAWHLLTTCQKPKPAS